MIPAKDPAILAKIAADMKAGDSSTAVRLRYRVDRYTVAGIRRKLGLPKACADTWVGRRTVEREHIPTIIPKD